MTAASRNPTPGSVLVTGSNRGLGLEWVRQYATDGWRVYATCRFPDDAADLRDLAAHEPNVAVHRLDVTHADEIRDTAHLLGDGPLDLLINNAGVYLERVKTEGLGGLDFDAWEETFRVNTLGAVRVTEALVPALARGRRPLMVAITSHMGSIADIQGSGSYAYRSSKAALNAVVKGLSVALRGSGIGCLLLHPGWVRTRMGAPGAPLSPTDSVRGMRTLVQNFTFAQTGRFLRYDGTEIPW